MTGDQQPGRPDGGDLVDWGRTGRRMRTGALVLAAAAVVAWLVSGAIGGDWSLRGLAGWSGAALGALFLVELVVVGGAALRGMLRAGERGERLASDGVGLLPPPLRRSAQRDDEGDQPSSTDSA